MRLRQEPIGSITFAAEDAARPFLTENEPMWRFFAPELRRRLADLHAAASAVERVRAALLEVLPAGDHTMTTVARHLATSPRTLQRQLQPRRHLLPGRPGRHPRAPGPLLPHPQRDDHRRDRLPDRLQRHQLLLPGLQDLDWLNPGRDPDR